MGGAWPKERVLQVLLYSLPLPLRLSEDSRCTLPKGLAAYGFRVLLYPFGTAPGLAGRCGVLLRWVNY